jgi:hypothetical protein
LINESFELSQHHSHVNENLAVSTFRFVALVRVRHAQLASISNLHRRADGAYESPQQIIKIEPIGTVRPPLREAGGGVLPTLGLWAGAARLPSFLRGERDRKSHFDTLV